MAESIVKFRLNITYKADRKKQRTAFIIAAVLFLLKITVKSVDLKIFFYHCK